MMVVSKGDRDYLQKVFPEKQVNFIPSFHANTSLQSYVGSGDYFLYHGNIEVPENEAAAKFLISKVFAKTKHKLIIAGMNPPRSIYQLAAKHKNLEIIANPKEAEMTRLIKEAHANILVTFQASGLKLKLLNTLYNGRHCIVNSTMLNGTDLEDICIIGNKASDLRRIIDETAKREFTAGMIRKRSEILQVNFSNTVNGDKLIDIIFNR
jgi:hypothetical protein